MSYDYVMTIIKIYPTKHELVIYQYNSCVLDPVVLTVDFLFGYMNLM